MVCLILNKKLTDHESYQQQPSVTGKNLCDLLAVNDNTFLWQLNAVNKYWQSSVPTRKVLCRRKINHWPFSLILTKFSYLHIFTTSFLKNDINTNITLCCQTVLILNAFHVFPVYGTCSIQSTILRLREEVMKLFRLSSILNENCLLDSSCPSMSVHLSICPHVKAQHPPDRFL